MMLSQPLISLVMPVYNINQRWLDAAINSVRHQTYPHWQLCISDDNSTRSEIRNYLNQLSHTQIDTIFLKSHQGIAAASNAGLNLAKGEYIGFLDHDDTLTPNALQEVADTINRSAPDLIYSDEEYIQTNGRCYSRHFKPDYAPDLLLSINYICHFIVYRRVLLAEIGGLREGYDGAQDYDLLLRSLDHKRKIIHIKKSLYQWRRIPGSTAERFNNKHHAWEAGRRALADTLQRRSIAGEILLGKHPGLYRVRRNIQGQPLISILLPFRDMPALLDRCLNSILTRTTYSNFELIGISNQSCNSKTYALMNAYLQRDSRIRFIYDDQLFNFSAINNRAVQLASGTHLLLLNNDIEVITPNWLEALLEHSQRPEVGAVGAKLYYPNDTVQHAGIIIGIAGSAGHAHKGFDRNDPGYFNRLDAIQNVSAVTGACLMVKRSLYLEVGGLNEYHLPISFNDVDFCLRLRERGYLNVFTPYCELYHHESRSRGYENTVEKRQRFTHERAYLRQRHSVVFAKGDPYYNPNLPLDRENFGLRLRRLRPLAFMLRNMWQRHYLIRKTYNHIVQFFFGPVNDE